jgi:acyl carrier protein
LLHGQLRDLNPVAGAVELTAELRRATGHDLPTTLLFDYPTVKTLVAYITALTPAQVAGVDSGASWTDVRAEVAAAVQGLLGGSVGFDVPLAQAGLDSLAAVELRNQLCRYSPLLSPELSLLSLS